MHVSTDVTVRLTDNEAFRTEGRTTHGLNPVTVLAKEVTTLVGSGKVYVRGSRMTARGWSMTWVRAVVEDLSTFPADVLRALHIDPEGD